MTKCEVFTSDLTIHSSDKRLEDSLVNASRVAQSAIYQVFNYFNPDSTINQQGLDFNLKRYLANCYKGEQIASAIESYQTLTKSERYDATGCLKGLFISYLFDFCKDTSLAKDTDFYINFGGDIYGRGRCEIEIENSDVSIKTASTHAWACFTSGNFGNRGKHIVMLKSEPEKYKSITVFVPKASPSRLAYYDMLATRLYSLNSINPPEGENVHIISIDTNGKVKIGGPSD